MKVGRNDPCPCGSGKKYKNCCEGKATTKEALTARSFPILVGVAVVTLVVLVLVVFYAPAPSDESEGRVWSVEHGHWHDANGQHTP